MAMDNSNINDDLPEIPGKRYFTIGEVSQLCRVKPHVLRYWEQEFPRLNPAKRRGNRRYYQHKDVLMIREIRHLLYKQGYTISGARTYLNNRNRHTQANPAQPEKIQDMVKELQDLMVELEG